jgi:phosphate transport system permease protein
MADAAPGSLAAVRRRHPAQGTFLLLIGAAAVVSILITAGIVITLVEEGAGFFRDVSIVDFLTGTEWFPRNGQFGVLPLLSASLIIAAIAAAVAVPIGLGAAIYLADYASERVRRVVKPTLELLAGMPTIVLGFFALDSVTPFLRSVGVLDENQAFSALSAGIVVGVLIVPLISSLSEDAMRAVPGAMREGAYGVGATRRQVVTRVVFPAALSGIVASIVLGLSRAVGETMAVTLAAGGQPNLTGDITAPMQTITARIVETSRGEAARGSVEYESIFALGIMLFVVTLLVNVVAVRLVRRYRTVYH